MIVCIVGVKLPKVLSCRTRRSRGPSPRQHLRQFDTNNTHTIMFDPDYNMMPQFFSTATNILLIKSNYSLNREQPQSPLPCHHIILAASITVTSTPVAKMRMIVFVGDWSCEIELRQTGVICFPWRQWSWSCGVFKSWISDAHCPFQCKCKLHTTMIYPCFSRLVCFSMRSPAWWRFDLCSSGCSPLSRWRDDPLVREFQMWHRICKQRDQHWFLGHQMRF